MMGYGWDDRKRVVRYQAKKGIFLFSKEARHEMGPTQPPIEHIPGALSEAWG
jgi:hypothetical protein